MQSFNGQGLQVICSINDIGHKLSCMPFLIITIHELLTKSKIELGNDQDTCIQTPDISNTITHHTHTSTRLNHNLNKHYVGRNQNIKYTRTFMHYVFKSRTKSIFLQILASDTSTPITRTLSEENFSIIQQYSTITVHEPLHTRQQQTNSGHGYSARQLPSRILPELFSDWKVCTTDKYALTCSNNHKKTSFQYGMTQGVFQGQGQSQITLMLMTSGKLTHTYR